NHAVAPPGAGAEPAVPVEPAALAGLPVPAAGPPHHLGRGVRAPGGPGGAVRAVRVRLDGVPGQRLRPAAHAGRLPGAAPAGVRLGRRGVRRRVEGGRVIRWLTTAERRVSAAGTSVPDNSTSVWVRFPPGEVTPVRRAPLP